MTVKLLTEHRLEFLSLKGDCTGSSMSTLVKMPHCWKSHVIAYIIMYGTKPKRYLIECIRFSKHFANFQHKYWKATNISKLCFILMIYLRFYIKESITISNKSG